MIDLGKLRHEGQALVKAFEKRGLNLDLKNFHTLDRQHRALRVQYEAVLASRKQTAQQHPHPSGEEAGGPLQDWHVLGKNLKQEAEELKGAVQEAEAALHQFLSQLPNLLDESVPSGPDPSANVEIHKKGRIPSFEYAVRDHVELGQLRDTMEFSIAAQVSGARFVYLKRELAALQRALVQLMLDLHTQVHGYTELACPYLVRSSALFGTGNLPKFAADLFCLQHTEQELDPLYLIPTAEIPLTNFVRGQRIPRDRLPFKWVSHTPCFRSEAGSYGKDTRGLIRQHQFEKVELVQIVSADQSATALEALTQHAEQVLEALELPYRRLELCGGDIGFSASKTYDLEVWMPSQACYREISSCSNCKDFQARRMNTKEVWTPPGSARKQAEFVHTLNGSGVAVGRAMAALLENFQTAEGNVHLPEKLRPYLGGRAMLWNRP